MYHLMIFFLFLIASLLHEKGNAKVYDCFLFFNELDLLEIRLNELYDHVDKFVLVESVETFRGNLKPLYYEENKNRFEKFADKIIHVIVEERQGAWNPWHVEAFQRNQIMRGLKECQPDDTILVSDVDEIVRASVLPQIYSGLYVDKKNYLQCEQILYRYYLNVKDYKEYWTGTCATTYENLCKVLPNPFRIHRHVWNYHTIANGGWHFSSMGGLASVIKKLESFSHIELDYPENKTIQSIYQHMQNTCVFVPIDHTYPSYILDNLPYYFDKSFIFLPLVTIETNSRDVLISNRQS